MRSEGCGKLEQPDIESLPYVSQSGRPVSVTSKKICSFLKELEHAYGLRAAQAKMSPRQRVSICQQTIEIAYANTDLFAAISPVFSALSEATLYAPALKVFLFDSPNGDWPVLLAELFNSQPQQALETISGAISTYCDERFSIIWNNWSPLAELVALDRLNNTAFVCLKHEGGSEAISHYRFAPLRNLFAAWFANTQSPVLHAAAVGTSAGGVIIGGNNGAGKSTSSLSCIGTSLRFMGDDSVLVTVNGTPAAHMLYASGSLRGRDLVNFPLLHDLPLHPNQLGTKVGFDLTDRPEWVVSSFPLRAVLVAQQVSKPYSYLEPISAGEALRALAPSSVTRNPTNLAGTFQQLRTLVSQLPCLRLNIGTRKEGIATAIAEFLQRMTLAEERLRE